MAGTRRLKNFSVSCFMVQIYKSDIVDLLRGDDEPIRVLKLEYYDECA